MSEEIVARPDRDEYLMSLAVDVAARCNCRKTVVGAIIVKDGRIASTGYNGTIKGFLDCIDGGCPRCNDNTESGAQLDRCICVHAEQNALLAAARFGVSVAGAEVWITTEPCLDCTKSLIQAGVGKVIYWRLYPLKPESQELRLAMRRLCERHHDVRALASGHQRAGPGGPLQGNAGATAKLYQEPARRHRAIT